jgi:hypothetical protein
MSQYACVEQTPRRPIDAIILGLSESGDRSFPPGENVPVAVARSGDVAAVLCLVRDPDGPESWQQEIQVFTEDPDGEWRFRASSGSDWPFRSDDRPASYSISLSGFVGGFDDHQFISGMAGLAVAYLSVELNGTERRVPVAADTGAFLIPTDVPHGVNVVDLDLEVAVLDPKGRQVGFRTRLAPWGRGLGPNVRSRVRRREDHGLFPPSTSEP